MSNPIDQNFRGDQFNVNLSFIWVAIFRDSSIISQFDVDGKEHLFKEVKDKFENLVYFNLTDRKGKLFTIDLIHGIIGYNYLALPYIEVEPKENIRLIFFRRHKVEMTEQMVKKSHTIVYHLGFQYNRNGKNRQIILQIDSEGNWIIES